MTNGHVAPGFEGVAEAFEQGFAERDELGASFAVVRDGELVVDLWGGVADPGTGQAWERDTLAVIFSGTKGLVATCLLILLDRGALELDAPVSRYWPEFAAAGKERVLVRHVVAHTAGLPGVTQPLQYEDLLDPERLAALLATQPCVWPPGERLCYHALTYGWLCAELIRRIDGRGLGRFFAEEIAEPLGLELWIGLPQAQEARVARTVYARDWGQSPISATDACEDPVYRSLWANPPLFDPREPIWNRRDTHAAEIGGVNAIGTARSVARLYGCLARGGELGGRRILSQAAVQLAEVELSRGADPFLPGLARYGFGFALQTPERLFGPVERGFGHGGAGGSLHGAWPAERIGFSYSMNLLRDDAGDTRRAVLLDALAAAVPTRVPDAKADVGVRSMEIRHMTHVSTSSALDLIGATPLLTLSRLQPGRGRIVAKAEFMQPGGSVKDRAAKAIVLGARASGELRPGQPVVEMTSGNMGAGLAVVCNVLGHPLVLAMSAGNSPARVRMLEGLGAEVVLVPQVDGAPGRVTGADIAAASERARTIAAERGGLYVDQFHNPQAVNAHEDGMGPEIWRQAEGEIDAFVAAVGTGATFVGVSRFLKQARPEIVCAAVEPARAAVLAGEPVVEPTHVLQGTGYGAVPPLWEPSLADAHLGVSDEEATEYRRLLALREGLYVGFSAAANVCAAAKLLASGVLAPDACVATVLCDTGLKY